MMRRPWACLTTLLLLLAHGLPLVCSAASGNGDGFCFDACRTSFSTVQFVDADPTAHFLSVECKSLLNLQSLYLCAGIHCSQDARVDGLGALNQTCREATGRPIPPYDVVSNFTREDIESLPRFNATDPPREAPVGEIVLPTDDLVALWIRTLGVQAYVRNYHWTYGWAMGLFWAVVVAIGTANRVVKHLEVRRRTTPLSNEESSSWRWIKRSIGTPASFGRRCAQDYGGWCTVPPLVQSLTILLFVLLNVACSIHGYRVFPGHMYFPAVATQWLRHVSDRTGIMSFANFPIIWLFGMRNNLALWLTGWDFGTYNNFHRWVARVATVQAVIHSVGYTILVCREGGWTSFVSWWTFLFWWAGELATIFMCAILVFSVYWLRRRQYEAFLIIHIGLSILVLLTMLGHVSIFSGEYNALVWVPALTWAADRVLRATRVVAFNRRFWDTTAQATFTPAANMVRLEIPVSSSMYRVRPGTFFYLTMVNDSRFWESHPFTVASTSSCYGQDGGTVANEAVPLLEGGYDAPREVLQRGDALSEKTESMTFLIRPYDSFTSRLKDLAEAQWPKPASIRMAVDGPYGNTLPLHLFDTVVFVVGGSGIVVPLSYAAQLTGSSPRPHCVCIHWAVRQPALAAEVIQRDLKQALGCINVSLDVHLTGSDGHEHGVDGIHGGVKWHWGRIDAAAVVKEAVGDAGDGSVAVVACGPARMADDARRATVEAMGSSDCRIDYFEESFQW